MSERKVVELSRSVDRLSDRLSARVGIATIELQRIANALDRLVSMEAQRLPVGKRPQ